MNNQPELAEHRPCQTGCFPVWQGTLAEIDRAHDAELWLTSIEQLRAVHDLWAKIVSKYQRRNDGLRDLQTVVMEISKQLVGKHGAEVDAAIDDLTEALQRSTAVDDAPICTDDLGDAAKALCHARAAVAERERWVLARLPSVDTLRQWMHDKTPIYLTFEGGAALVEGGHLPANRSIHRATAGAVHDQLSTRAVSVQLPDGKRWLFSLDGNHESEGAFPWLTSIGVRRDTVSEPCPRLTKAYADLGVEAPVQRVDVWVKATDPVVVSWVDRDIELTTAHMAPTTVRLLEVRQDVIVVQEPGIEGEQVLDRRWFEVRPVWSSSVAEQSLRRPFLADEAQ